MKTISTEWTRMQEEYFIPDFKTYTRTKARLNNFNYGAPPRGNGGMSKRQNRNYRMKKAKVIEQEINLTKLI